MKSHIGTLIVATLLIATSGCVSRRTQSFEARSPGDTNRINITRPALPRAPALGGQLEIHFVNVGQGDCTLVKMPNGKRMLVDCGSTTKNQSAAPIRSYLLKQLGNHKRIDAVVVTHPDADHYNFLPEV